MPLPNINLNGNLTADPELRFLSDGTAVLSMRVACNERYKKDGTWTDGSTTFMKVNVWRNLAENCAGSLRKGDAIVVQGKLKQNEYVDKNNENRISFEVEADTVAKRIKALVS